MPYGTDMLVQYTCIDDHATIELLCRLHGTYPAVAGSMPIFDI